MNQILPDYQQLNPTTWMYVSSLMTIAIFFKFNRVWSVRNLDVLAIISFGPGLLLVSKGQELEQIGYIWLFAASGFFLIRMLADTMMVRRPLLEPNLTSGGLTFMGCALLVFSSAAVISKDLTEDDLAGARQVDYLINREVMSPDESDLGSHGPGYPLLYALASIPNRLLLETSPDVPEDERSTMLHAATTRTLGILAQLAVVLGMVVVGMVHFENIKMGIGAASLYLVLPYTTYNLGEVDHILPAALLVWAVVAYRRPFIAGMLLGLAGGTIYYPLFLLPLWLSFYWQRGRMRFIAGAASTLALSIGSLALTSSSFDGFVEQLRSASMWMSLTLDNVGGFWAFAPPAYRVTAATLFVVLALSLVLWPTRKDLGTLLSCSAAVMLGVQFWHTDDGGLYMAWYLPLLLLAVFRPNLEDRVALSVLGTGWRRPRAAAQSDVGQAA